MEKRKANVLLVDDEEQFLDALSQRLEARGLKVKAVTSGEDAVDQVEDHNFDAIIVDLAMPGIDGIRNPEAHQGKASGSGNYHVDRPCNSKKRHRSDETGSR